MKKQLIKPFLIMAAFVLMPVFLKIEVKAADEKPLVNVEELKMTQVSDATFETMKKGAKVSGKKAFIKEFRKNALKRKKSFTITCASFNDIDENVYDHLDTIDSKKTSDDADFLKGGILDLGWTGYYNSNGEAIINCKLVYTENQKQVKKVNAQSKKILKKLKVSNMSDVAKVKAIHDHVVKLVTYDNSLQDHSAYGGLAASKHSTVCQGYALIMYKLLTDAGVPVHYVTGDAGGPHAWNIVKIQGKWYCLDATWDDPSDSLVYDYFLVGTKTFNKDHKTDNYYAKKYKLASSDLNWKKLLKSSKNKDDSKVKSDQTKEEIKAGENAIARQEVIKVQNESLDSALSEDPDATEYEKQMYDLCKKIYGFIIEDMSDAAFEKFLESEEMMDVYTDYTLQLIDEYIMDPMTEYVKSEEFTNDVYTAMYNDFDQDAFSDLSDEDMESIFDAYAYECYTDALYMQSQSYTESLVYAVVKELESMV